MRKELLGNMPATLNKKIYDHHKRCYTYENDYIHMRHQEAMSWAEKGDNARRHGEGCFVIRNYFARAFNHERIAALTLFNRPIEPTRSILFLSAAKLALESGARKKASEMAQFGLGGGNPPPEIEAELREVLERARKPKEEK